jgi:Holliday junction resolvasome RuvABC endonuclease subunit
MNILAIDQSTTAPGVCRYIDGKFDVEEWELPKHKKLAPVLTEDRLDIIEARFKLDLAENYPYDLVVLEGPAYGSNGTGHGAVMGVYWKLRCVAHRAGIQFEEIEPTRLKLWACGNGKAEKPEMIAAAAAYFRPVKSVDQWTDNMADAAWIAHFAAVIWGDAEFPDFDASTTARQYVYLLMTGHLSEAVVMHKRLENERKAARKAAA